MQEDDQAPVDLPLRKQSAQDLVEHVPTGLSTMVDCVIAMMFGR